MFTSSKIPISICIIVVLQYSDNPKTHKTDREMVLHCPSMCASVRVWVKFSAEESFFTFKVVTGVCATSDTFYFQIQRKKKLLIAVLHVFGI